MIYRCIPRTIFSKESGPTLCVCVCVCYYYFYYFFIFYFFPDHFSTIIWDQTPWIPPLGFCWFPNASCYTCKEDVKQRGILQKAKNHILYSCYYTGKPTFLHFYISILVWKTTWEIKVMFTVIFLVCNLFTSVWWTISLQCQKLHLITTWDFVS